jgi:hypothetical protein
MPPLRTHGLALFLSNRSGRGGRLATNLRILVEEAPNRKKSERIGCVQFENTPLRRDVLPSAYERTFHIAISSQRFGTTGSIDGPFFDGRNASHAFSDSSSQSEGIGSSFVEHKGMNLNDIIFQGSLDGHRTGLAIFAVEHVLSGKRLIVSTACLSKRLYDQRRYLQRREHHNPALRADLLRDGPDAFRFVLLDIVRDKGELQYMRRLHVEDSRRRGKTYHLDEPTERKLLLPVNRTTSAGSTSAEERLSAVQRRLEAFNETSRQHPELIEAWLRETTHGVIGESQKR